MAQNGSTQPSVAHQALFSVAGVGVHGVARFIYAIVVGRVLGLDTLAAFTTALALTLIVSLLWPTGLGVATAHFTAHLGSSAERSGVLSVALRSFALVTVPLSAGAALVSVLLGAPVPVAMATGLLAFSYSAYVTLRSVLLALHLALQVAIWEALTAALALLGLAAVVSAGANDWVLAPLALAYLPFLVLAGVRLARIRRSGTSQFAEAASLYRLSGWNSGSFLAANGLLQLSVIAVYAAADSGDQAALYAAAVSIAGPAGMLAQALAQVLQPRVSNWRAREVDAGRTAFVHIAVRALIGLTVLFAGVIALSPTLVHVFLGSRYEGAGLSLQILMAGMWAFSISSVLAVAPIAARREHSVTFAYTAGAVAGALIALACWPFAATAVAGAIGVSSGYVVAAALVARVARLAYRSN